MGDTPDWTGVLSPINDILSINTSISGTALAPGAFVTISLNQYAGLTVAMQSNVVQIVELDWSQSPSHGGPAQTFTYSEFLTNAASAVTAEFSLPCRDGQVQITNLSSAAINLIVYGTSRPADRARNIGETWSARALGYTGAITAGTPVTLVNIDGGPDSVRFNGQCSYRAATSSGAALMGYRWITRTGASRDVYFAQIPTGASAFGIIALPVGVVKPIILPQTTAASNTYSFDIAPGDN